MSLFKQNDFSGGMFREFDSTKIPPNAYPLLINGRTRENVVTPTSKHLELDGPAGTYQGLYVAGSIIVLFADGVAYYGNINQNPVSFTPLAGWSAMSTSASRIYAQIIPTTANFLNRNGTPDLVTQAFNGSIASFQQCLLVFDGISQTRAVFPSGTFITTGTYNQWTKNNPVYIPSGVLPAVVNNKLFLASADRQRIYHSVTGRMTDFVVNIDADGNAGGDAETVATAVSFDPLTAIRALATNQLLCTTLYGSYLLTLDYEDPKFAEPYLRPTFLFAAGCVNDLSLVDVILITPDGSIRSDIAFITQTGIYSFNDVLQAKRESTNLPFGSKIRGLLRGIQADTCAINYQDYALFSVNTIYGRGVLVYDNTRQAFQSLDTSFGHVKQFANTRISGSATIEGQERLFYITHDNKIFEAFGDTSAVNTTRVYLGEWSPEEAGNDLLIDSVDLEFGNVEASGAAKVSSFVDHEFKEAKAYTLTVEGFENNYPIPVPFESVKAGIGVNCPMSSRAKGGRFGTLVEWNFRGNLVSAAVNGQVEVAANVTLAEQVQVMPERFAFIADTGGADELNTGGSFDANGLRVVTVTPGARYIFSANGDGNLVSGAISISQGMFTANNTRVTVKGTALAATNFSLRTITNFMSVLDAIQAAEPLAIIGGGDHSYPNGSSLDVTLGKLPITIPFHPVAGNHDYDTLSGSYFFNKYGIPRYYSKRFTNVEFFFYNGGWTTANVPVNANGITSGATSEPDGNNSTSLQSAWLRNAITASTAMFKIIIVHEPPWTTDDSYYPGYADLRFLSTVGADAVISGHGHSMERWDKNGFPFFVCGVGGRSLRGFRANTAGLSAYRNSADYGYLEILVDPLGCKLSFKNTTGQTLDSYDLHS